MNSGTGISDLSELA